MKKIITLILALAMALSLVACGGQTAPAEPRSGTKCLRRSRGGPLVDFLR